MKIDVQPGKYVVAVSGGVDSVVLLDLLRMYPGVQVVVAHYDHGIRDDSHLDRAHVQALARRYQLPFVYDKGRLGPGASEAEARAVRYEFLRKAQAASSADALVTAHHQDDVLETAIINLLRGTGRKGLSSLTSGEGIIRPLLDVPKTEIIDYAKRHGLQWREDSTNLSTDILRNRIRHEMLPGWSTHDKQRLLSLSLNLRGLNQEIDKLLTDVTPPFKGPSSESSFESSRSASMLDREWFILLPHAVSREVMASWLRGRQIRDFDRHTLERLTVAGKTAEPGKAVDIVRGHRMQIGKQHLALEHPER
jgi:tRNA(Ile)-lysidine synthetase-like protein